MKTILAATDFSRTSRNAMYYAAEMALFTGADLVLFHAYPLNIGMRESVALSSPAEIEHECNNDLLDMICQIRSKYGYSLAIQYACKPGDAYTQIYRYTRSHPVDLVVLGMTRADGHTSHVAASCIRHCQCPVMLIPEEVRFSPHIPF